MKQRVMEMCAGGVGRVVLLLGLVALPGCSSGTGPQPQAWDSTLPVWSTPEAAGFNQAGLDQVTTYVETLNTTGLVVMVGGRMLHFQGDVDQVSVVASVRKSILSVLYGRYVEDGTIDLDATLADLGVSDIGGLLPIEQQATVRHILTARSGVYHPASNGGDDTQFAPPRGSQQPGSYFLYNNWDFNAAGGMFESLTGRNIYDALRDDLAVPLGMEDFNRQAQEKSGDLTKSEYPAYHMNLSTRDMARIGQLVLQQGSWNGTELVPAEWVELSTRASTPLEEMNPDSRREKGRVGFGMMWWVWDGPKAVGAFEGAYTAAGYRGQFITVLPALDMVVAHKTAGNSSNRTLFAEYMGVLDRLAEASDASGGD